jgi:hypothetical protein
LLDSELEVLTNRRSVDRLLVKLDHGIGCKLFAVSNMLVI